MTDPEPSSSFRRNLIRVMSVEVATLLLLWLFQRHFTH
jgi:hypothetical protein